MSWNESCQTKKTDLHVHTTASDGRFPPAEIVRLAVLKGITTLAVTDHDTVSGLEEAKNEAFMRRLAFIPGLELSTVYDDVEVHILGYGIQYEDGRLADVLHNLMQSREKRAEKIVDKLNTLGYPVTMEEVRKKAGSGSMGRPHIAMVMQDHGFVEDIQDGVTRFLNPGCPAYIPRLRISPLDAISLIRESGGIPVLAHPGDDLPQQLLPLCVENGLAGLEVYHPKHTPQLVRHFYDMAVLYNLLITGGSDFHGYTEEDWKNFGSMPIPDKSIGDLKRNIIQLED